MLIDFVGEKQNGAGGVADCKTDKSKLSITTGVEISGMEGSLMCI